MQTGGKIALQPELVQLQLLLLVITLLRTEMIVAAQGIDRVMPGMQRRPRRLVSPQESSMAEGAR